jgi:hypothetical protein
MGLGLPMLNLMYGMQPPPTQADLIPSPDDGLDNSRCNLDRSLGAWFRHHMLDGEDHKDFL